MFIGHNLSKIAAKNPTKPAILFKNDLITYGQLLMHIGAIQKGLLEILGNNKRERIGIQLGNDHRFIEVFFASIMLGYSCIPLDPKWTEEQLTHALTSSKPNLIINDQMYKEIISSEKSEIKELAEQSDIFYIGFTSGSTGKPKGFARTHLSWIDSFLGCNSAFKITEEDVISAPGPLCHSLTLYAAMYSIHIGATFILSEKFEAMDVLQSIDTNKATTLFVVPTMLHAMLEHSGDRKIRSVRKTLSSGAKWLPSQKERLSDLFPNSERIEYYGASETSFISYLLEEDHHLHSSSVGKPFPGVKLFVKERNGKQLRENEVGLIYVKSSMIFSGYIDQHHLSQHEEITVGDIGFINKDGYLTLIGRESNMIISGGLNIYPEEIEAVIKKINNISEAIVMGVYDEYWGEKVVALIKWDGPHSLSANELQLFCKQHLSSYKCPKSFYEVENFPYTSSGKIARQLISYPIGSEIR